MNEKIEIKDMMANAQNNYHKNIVDQAIKDKNVTFNEEELSILYQYAREGKDFIWLIRHVKSSGSLLKAIASYHSDWNGAQGN